MIGPASSGSSGEEIRYKRFAMMLRKGPGMNSIAGMPEYPGSAALLVRTFHSGEFAEQTGRRSDSWTGETQQASRLLTRLHGTGD